MTYSTRPIDLGTGFALIFGFFLGSAIYMGLLKIFWDNESKTMIWFRWHGFVWVWGATSLALLLVVRVARH